MLSAYASLKDLLPSMPSVKTKIKLKIDLSKNYEESCQCNKLSCLICSRKRSSSMISLKPIKQSIIVDQSTIEKADKAQFSSLIAKKLSKQSSSKMLQNTYYGGNIINESKDATTSSSSWLQSKTNSRKISINNSPTSQIPVLFKSQSQPNLTIGRHFFRFIYVIGKGGFGKVWRVEMKSSKQEFALKEMLKAKIISKRSVNSVMNEKFLLEHLRHPFIVNMHYAFQDRENLYLVLDLLRGGDLRFHIGKNKKFSEDQAKFFACCIILALQYLHSNGIIHRDLKPENLVFDKDGYLHLTDLGVARLNKDSIANDTSGTPGYMAPEVMCRMEHSFPVDFYALGVILYELLMGKRPYNGKNRQEIRDQILAKQVLIKEGTPNITPKAIDFINKLLTRKPQQRMGFSGIEEIIHHSWLKNFPWSKLLNKELKSIYIPGNVDGNTDFQNQISADSELEDGCQTLLRRKSVQSLFDGYKFL